MQDTLIIASFLIRPDQTRNLKPFPLPRHSPQNHYEDFR